MKSVITKLIARTEDQTFGRIPYDVEIKGAVPGAVVVAKLPKISDTSETLVEITTPATGSLALSTMDAIARQIIPGAKVRAMYGGTTARRRVYAAN